MSLWDVDGHHPAQREQIVPRLELVVLVFDKSAKPGYGYREVVLPLTEAQNCALLHSPDEQVLRAGVWLRTPEEK